MNNLNDQDTAVIFFDSISGHTFTAVEVKEERVSPVTVTVNVDPESVARRRQKRKRHATTDVLAEDAHCIVLEAPYLRYQPQHIPDSEKVDKTHEVVFKCAHCPEIFPSVPALEIHNVFHTSRTEFRCKDCLFRCTQESNLTLHIKNFHAAKCSSSQGLKCFECPCEFPDSESLSYHRMVVHKSYTCNHCSMAFPSSQCMMAHIGREHVNRDFICQVCRACFNTKGKLMQHMSGHVEELPYGCGHCQFACALHSELKEHVKKYHS